MPNNLQNYLKPINQITQGEFQSGFGTTLNTLLSDINENFKRLVSIPFLKGDKGDNIVIVYEKIYTLNAQTPASSTFTSFGEKFVNAIYGASYSLEGQTFAYLKTILDNTKDRLDFNSTGTDVLWSCEMLNPDTDENPNFNNEIGCYTIENDYSKGTFVALYHFHDYRVDRIDEADENWSRASFVDRSCTLYAVTTQNAVWDSSNHTWGGGWDIKRYETVPTLYYDSVQGYFCWHINGMESGISAQGIKGDIGEKVRVYVCRGRRYTNSQAGSPHSIWVADILSCNDDDYSVSPPVTYRNVNDIREGDLLYVWFKEDNSVSIPQTIPPFASGDLVTNFSLGLAHRADSSTTSRINFTYNPDIDLIGIMSELGLRSMLESVGYDSTSTSDASLRGLVIPSHGVASTLDDSEAEHLIYSKNVSSTEDELHITRTTRGQTKAQSFDSSSSPAHSNGKSSFVVDYNKLSSNDWSITQGQTTTTGYYKNIDEDTTNNTTFDELSSATQGTPGSSTIRNQVRSTVPNESTTVRMKVNQSHPELGVNMQDVKSVFIGGRNLTGLGGARQVHDGAGNVLNDEYLAYQQIQKEKDGTRTFGFDDCSVSNIFNFCPPVGGNESSYLNLRHVKNENLSSQHTQNFSLCFNPNAELKNENGKYYLRLYLPTVQYLRNFSQLGNESGNLNSINSLNEILLYDKKRFVCNTTRSCGNNIKIASLNNNIQTFLYPTPTYTFTSSDTKLNMLREIGGSIISSDETNFSSVRCEKGNDYFDLPLGTQVNPNSSYSLLYKHTSGQNAYYRSYIYTRGFDLDSINTSVNNLEDTFGYTKTLINAKLESPVTLTSGSDNVEVNDNLFIHSIAMKCVSNDVVNKKAKIELVWFFQPTNHINPDSHNLKTNHSIFYSSYENSSVIIPVSGDGSVNNNYNITPTSYGTSTDGKLSIAKTTICTTQNPTYCSKNNIYGYCWKVNQIIELDYENDCVSSISPSSINECADYQYDGTGGLGYASVWRHSKYSNNCFAINQVLLSTEHFEYSYNDETNKLFIPAPTVNWWYLNGPDMSTAATRTVEYDYDSYELEIGNTLRASRPRHESMPYTMSTEFRPKKNSGSTPYPLVKPLIIKETKRNEPHEFLSYQYNSSSNTYLNGSVYDNNYSSLPFHSKCTAKSVFANQINSIIDGMFQMQNNWEERFEDTINEAEDIQDSSMQDMQPVPNP